MSTITFNVFSPNPSGFNKSFFSRFSARLGDLQEAIRREMEMRHAISELRRLSDRDLLDIGVLRCDIADRVRGR